MTNANSINRRKVFISLILQHYSTGTGSESESESESSHGFQKVPVPVGTEIRPVRQAPASRPRGVVVFDALAAVHATSLKTAAKTTLE